MRLVALALLAMAVGCKTSDPPGGDLDMTMGFDDMPAALGDLANGGGSTDLAGGVGTMTLTSTAFADGAAIPIAHAWNLCTPAGNNKNPPLAIGGVPAGTKSLAIMAEDNDVVFDHWGAWDLPPGMTTIMSGSSAMATYPQAQNSFGNHGYGGPCPPAGATHTYSFTVYALDVATLGKADGTAYDEAMTAITAHATAHATLHGKYTH